MYSIVITFDDVTVGTSDVLGAGPIGRHQFNLNMLNKYPFALVSVD